MKKTLLLKIGSSTLTTGTAHISYGKIEDIARQLLVLQEQFNIIIVSSGAVATARQFVGQHLNERNVESKQALSAIGQPKLMRIYDEIFESFDLHVAQCLLTYRDVAEAESRKNTIQTIQTLLANNYIPIINENDTVAVDELIVGDNDKLSALLAEMLDVDLLVIASDIDGLYTKNPHKHADAKLIETVNNIASVKQYIDEKAGGLGTGGMSSKLYAAEICMNAGIEMWIVGGGKISFLCDVMEGKAACTRFVS